MVVQKQTVVHMVVKRIVANIAVIADNINRIKSKAVYTYELGKYLKKGKK